MVNLVIAWCMNYVKWILTLHSLGSFNCESCSSDPLRHWRESPWICMKVPLWVCWARPSGPDMYFFANQRFQKLVFWVPIVRYGEYTLQGFITLQGHFVILYIDYADSIYCILQLNWMMMMRRRRIQVPIAVLTWLTPLTHPRSLKKPRPQWRRKEHDNVHYDRHEWVGRTLKVSNWLFLLDVHDLMSIHSAVVGWTWYQMM